MSEFGKYKCKSSWSVAYFVGGMWPCLPGHRRGCSAVDRMEHGFV
jgi:hypothetical protein